MMCFMSEQNISKKPSHLGHFVRHHFLQGSMPYISSELQIADLLTKSHTTVGWDSETEYPNSRCYPLRHLEFEGGLKHIDSY